MQWNDVTVANLDLKSLCRLVIALLEFYPVAMWTAFGQSDEGLPRHPAEGILGQLVISQSGSWLQMYDWAWPRTEELYR